MRTLPVLLMTLLAAPPALADETSELEYAVGRILEREGALFVDYEIAGNGKVTVLFGANEPEWRMRNTLKALQSHPNIAPALFWSRIDSEFCAIR